MKKVLRLVESYLLREEDEAGGDFKPEEKLAGQKQDSLDAQVDRFLMSYEKEAKGAKTEGFNFRSMTRRFLNEAEGDEEGDEGEQGSGDEGGGEDEADPESQVDEPTKLSLDDIDVNSFASSVARLIDNYDSLLEVRDTLVRRASKFLSKNYDSQVVSNFESVLRDEYDIEQGVSDVDKKYEIEVPNADRAGPSPGG